jgi:hypothetical protein
LDAFPCKAQRKGLPSPVVAIEDLRAELDEWFLAGVLRSQSLPLQAALVYRSTPQFTTPPLPAMLGSGKRRGEVRVPLWLWLLAIGNGMARSGSPPRFGSVRGAVVRDLGVAAGGDDDRRVQRAVQALVAAGHLSKDLQLRRETYGYEGEADRAARHARYDKEWATRAPDEYEGFDMPFGLWANGWIAALDHRSLCVLFAVRHMCRETGAWHRVPRVLRDRYSLTSATWNHGLRELYQLGLVNIVEKRYEVENRRPGVPQRWIRPDWTKLAYKPRVVLARRGGSRYADVETARRAGDAFVDQPVLKDRPPRTTGDLRTMQRMATRRLRDRLVAGDTGVVERAAELMRLLEVGGPQTARELAATSTRRVSPEELRDVTGLLEIMAEIAQVERSAYLRGAAKLVLYRLPGQPPTERELRPFRANPLLESL